MKELELSDFNYLTDEFGRIIIENKEILEYINGVSGLELSVSFNNTFCQSNAACGDAACRNLKC